MGIRHVKKHDRTALAKLWKDQGEWYKRSLRFVRSLYSEEISEENLQGLENMARTFLRLLNEYRGTACPACKGCGAQYKFEAPETPIYNKPCPTCKGMGRTQHEEDDHDCP